MIHFNLQQPPFSFLDASQLEWLRRRVIPVQFAAHDLIIPAGSVPAGLYLITYGVVEERDGDGEHILSQYSHDDIFDTRSALGNSICKTQYQAVDDTRCLVLKTADFHTLLHTNDDFSAYFRTDLGARQLLLDNREASGVTEFILGRVGDVAITSPVYVSGQTSLGRVAAIMEEKQCKAVLVRTVKNIGILTVGDIVKATMLGTKTRNTCAAEIATYPLITIKQGDFLFNALLKMTQYAIERVVVSHNDEIVGTLALLDMLNIFSSHSTIVSMRIEHATSIGELKIAADRIDALLSSLNNQGVNVIAIMELMTSLHRRLMQRTFELTFPAELHSRVCILALGSEGRGERITQPCHDNLVILDNLVDADAVSSFMCQWHDALCDMGYPRKATDFSQKNSNWLNNVEGWASRINRWLNVPCNESMAELATFIDAHVISGEAELFEHVKNTWIQYPYKTSALAALMAEPALKYTTPLTFLGNLRERHGTINIKKGGIYPLVQGIRALAFEYDIAATNTLERIEQLKLQKVISEEYAQSLRDTLYLLYRISIRYQLDSNQDTVESSNVVQLALLSRADRDMLRYALHRVKKFKQYISDHYYLDI